MIPLEYWPVILSQWQLYVIILLVVLLFHVYLIRYLVLSVLDPLFLVLVADIFSWTIVVFMFCMNDIQLKYLYSFAFSQLALYFGLIAGKRWKKHPAAADPNGKHGAIPVVTFCLSGAIHFVSNVVIWIYAGIPIFRESRLGTFSGAGGFGIIERFANVSGGIAVFAALYVFTFHSSRLMRGLVYLFFGWLLLNISLSGTRSALLLMGQLFFAFWFIYWRDPSKEISFWGGRKGALFLGLSSTFAFLMIFLELGDNSLLEAVGGFAFRLVSFGDIFIMAYPNQVIEQIQGSNPFIGLFGGFLSTFKLFPTGYLYQSIGSQFTNILFGDLGYIAGPNPRHNIVGYHYFGVFGFIFSFAVGYVMARIQSRFYFGKGKGFDRVLRRSLLYFCLVSLSSDFDYSMSVLAGTIIVYVAIYFGVRLLVTAGKRGAALEVTV